MQIDIPFKVEYLVDDLVPLSSVIDSLVAVKILIEEGSYNLPMYIDGLIVSKVDINVNKITQESPLRELMLVTLFFSFQEDLQREVPNIFANFTGVQVSDNFRTILTLSVVIVMFYGAAFAKDVVAGAVVDSKLRAQIRALISEVATLTGLSEAAVQSLLDKRYKPRSRIKTIADAAIKLVRPSQRENAPMLVGQMRIEPKIIEDFPEEYTYKDASKIEKSVAFTGRLHLHAQDKDKENAGWAAVPLGICDRRLRMKLVDGVTADQLWNKDEIIGSGVIKYKRVGADFVPSEIHLGRVVS